MFKLDENNQYDYLMMKLLSKGFIKRQEKLLILKQFNMLLETLDLDNQIGHLFVVDIEFNAVEATAKTLRYNQIYTPVFEKDKIVDAT